MRTQLQNYRSKATRGHAAANFNLWCGARLPHIVEVRGRFRINAKLINLKLFVHFIHHSHNNNTPQEKLQPKQPQQQQPQQQQHQHRPRMKQPRRQHAFASHSHGNGRARHNFVVGAAMRLGGGELVYTKKTKRYRSDQQFHGAERARHFVVVGAAGIPYRSGVCGPRRPAQMLHAPH
jgi:hypothetical protein